MSMEDIFVTFPRLETERLALRQIRASDADALFAFFSDEEVSSKRHRSVEESQAFIQQLQHWYQAHENVEWGITRKGDDMLIGTCGLYAFDAGFHRAETGYELLKACWRQGIMSEALTAILTFAFTTMGLHRNEAVVDEGNERSQGLLRKLGFVHEGTLRQRQFFGGRFWDEYHFGLLKDEWSSYGK
jgi:[ribosomal protein S5]-alanine N-acetyltransferase